MKRRAFTLTELIIVLGIIAALSALLFPVIVRAKRSAMQAESISNLRQCGVAIALYMEGEDLTGLPDYETAKTLLANAPTFDQADYLRVNRKAVFGPPLIGSFGYVRGVDEYGAHWGKPNEWRQFLQEHPDPYLFASVYYGKRPVVPFDGNDRNPCLADLSCAFPSRLIRVKSDTSVRISNFASAPEYGIAGTYSLFGWGSVFTALE